MEHPKDATRVRKYNISSSKGQSDIISFSKNFISGGIAGAISRTVVSPLERAKILFQVQNSGSTAKIGQKGYDSLASTFGRILRQEGIKGLFKGNGTNIIRIIPYSSMQFASYEFFLRIVARNKGIENVTVWERLASGACAGICAAIFTYPLDLVRTRLSLASDKQPSYGIIGCLKNVYTNEGGISALYKGLFPTLLGIAPLVAINFTVYEKLKQASKKMSKKDEISIPQRLVCGGAAGAIAQTITYPLDVLRRRLQSNGLLGFNYSGPLDALIRIYKEEGWRSFYRGMLPNYLKMVPAISISFVTYETIQAHLS